MQADPEIHRTNKFNIENPPDKLYKSHIPANIPYKSAMLETYLMRSLISIVLLNFVEPLAVFDKNYTKPYVLKKSWVQNFIKFQYIFEGKQRKAKIVPLGKFWMIFFFFKFGMIERMMEFENKDGIE